MQTSPRWSLWRQVFHCADAYARHLFMTSSRTSSAICRKRTPVKNQRRMVRRMVSCVVRLLVSCVVRLLVSCVVRLLVSCVVRLLVSCVVRLLVSCVVPLLVSCVVRLLVSCVVRLLVSCVVRLLVSCVVRLLVSCVVLLLVSCVVRLFVGLIRDWEWIVGFAGWWWQKYRCFCREFQACFLIVVRFLETRQWWRVGRLRDFWTIFYYWFSHFTENERVRLLQGMDRSIDRLRDVLNDVSSAIESIEERRSPH